ncbi:MAG TPA: sodium:solute symporter family protein [Thiobacillus sp.]|nr:MAG: sodium:solute symporter [Hydrogenophilales bacterium 28-61-11]OYZ57079.1 MAG: sodium:solute symporter [Hydrogenophilales bacterium 16-61-112]OZA42707.1 MAG: sodium:solute symporter [Hydrogenophilales bacterium 17-61-76]HQT29924.1 sodium:solute symporter family protein [Thiobacillus sp.]HQT69349.1 sodium:solute symporter family protein [Thiobacillus sp.]
MLIGFVIAYLIVSLGIGFYAATKVHSASDYITAGRSLPMIVVVAMVFATWFGAETVLGIPATFLAENLGGTIADPFGASLALILFGLFFARPLYRMKLMTLGDYFRARYNRPVEMVISLAIALSYLGWVSAQVVALGLVFNVLSDGIITQVQGIYIGATVVLLYTLFGGMWSVALTTLVQMTVIVAGLLWIAKLVGDMPAVNGVAPVIEHAAASGKFTFWPPLEWSAIVTFIAGLLTMGLGSIPQQDVFQRANSAKNERIAVWGTLVGGVLYFAFAAVPIYLTYAATLVDPALTASLLAQDAQQVLPAFVKAHLPLYAQIIFYGALLSVIMSTASGTLLAPSVTISENIIKELMPHHRMSQTKLLWITRSVVVVFTLLVVVYSLWSLQSNTSIHTMVANAYKITLACAFVPLVAGLYWKRANNAGAGLSIVLGLAAWIAMEFIAPEAALPPQFVGLLASAAGMLAGSVARPK